MKPFQLRQEGEVGLEGGRVGGRENKKRRWEHVLPPTISLWLCIDDLDETSRLVSMTTTEKDDAYSASIHPLLHSFTGLNFDGSSSSSTVSCPPLPPAFLLLPSCLYQAEHKRTVPHAPVLT